LIAEDHAASRRLLAAILESMGHEAEVAADGEEAWTKLSAQPFGLLISDWMMPGLDGLELCKRVRARKSAAYTYVILVTAKVAKEDYRAAMAAGVDDFITKPFEGDYLESRIKVADRILTLQHAVVQLEGLLPICSYCKRIRDAEDRWIPIDSYVHARAPVEFSHGMCPTCYQEKVEPELKRLGI
jgi:DNA-binding response OmpR family regulator